MSKLKHNLNSATLPLRPPLSARGPLSIPTSTEAMSSEVPPSLNGADAWAYMLRQRLLRDACSLELYDTIQTGFYMIDQYLADIYSAPPSSTTNLIELMKTPGRNKGPGTAKKARPAVLAAAETTLQPVGELDFGTTLAKENIRPAESFEPQHDNPFGGPPLLGARNTLDAPSTVLTSAINAPTKPQGPRENAKRPLPPLPKSASVVSLMPLEQPQPLQQAGESSMSWAVSCPSIPPSTVPSSSKCVAKEDSHGFQAQQPNMQTLAPPPPQVPTSNVVPTALPISVQEITVPLNDTKSSSTIPQAGTGEASIAFPTAVRKHSCATLPEPSPHRRSTRSIARPQPATTTPVAGSTGAIGVRSSWLRRDTHLPDRGLTGVTAKNTMANAGPLNPGLPFDGPLTGSKRKSTGMQDEVDNPRSMKIARKESQEKKPDMDTADAHARVAAQAALRETAQERPAKVPQPELVARPRPPVEQPPPSIFDDETQIIPHDDEEDTNERLQRLTKIVKAALPGSREPSGGVVQMEVNDELKYQRPSKKEKREDSGRLRVSHLAGVFEKKDQDQSYRSTTPLHSPPMSAPAPPPFKFVPPKPLATGAQATILKPIFQPLPPKSAATRTSSQPVFTRPQAQHPTIAPFAPSQPANSKEVFTKDSSRPPPTSIFNVPPDQSGLGGIGVTGPAWQPIFQPFTQGTQSTELESIFDASSQGTSQPTTVQMSQSSGRADDTQEETGATFPGWSAIKPDEDRGGETMAWVKNVPGGETEECIPEPNEEVDASDEGDARASSQESEVPESEAIPVKGANTTTATTSGRIFAFTAAMASKATNQLKSLRLAAAAAEKDKAEKEKKEQRKLEMEARRQATAKKKADEERERREEAERKRKAEEERRKKEREEAMANRSTKLGKSTAQQEEVSKKPLKFADTEKKIPQLKKQPSKACLGVPTTATNSVKTVTSTGIKPQPAASSAGTVKLVSQSSTVQTFKKIVATTPKSQHEKQPSQLVQAQMQARYQAQFREEDLDAGGIDESADLPDINSAYSDSEDEDRPPSFNPPDWAQSPNLQSALETMRTVNPDTIFGAVPKLEMEEIFPGRRGNKFRVRTSSANWAGADGVTVEEEIEYAKRMGFTD